MRVVAQDSEGVVVAAREELYGREPQQGFRPPHRLLDNFKGADQEHARLVVRTFSPVAECEFTARGGSPLRLPKRFKTRGAFADKVFCGCLRPSYLLTRTPPPRQ